GPLATPGGSTPGAVHGDAGIAVPTEARLAAMVFRPAGSRGGPGAGPNRDGPVGNPVRPGRAERREAERAPGLSKPWRLAGQPRSSGPAAGAGRPPGGASDAGGLRQPRRSSAGQGGGPPGGDGGA